MTEAGSPGPSSDSWVASVHAGERDLAPLGSAVVADARRVLTCAHVVLDGTVLRQPLWVCFPKSDVAGDEWRLVESVDWAYEPPVTDVAVLLLDRDVPSGVEVAPVRCPRPGDVVGKRWWAFGFPYIDSLGQCDPIGDCADGLIGAALARGWVRWWWPGGSCWPARATTGRSGCGTRAPRRPCSRSPFITTRWLSSWPTARSPLG